MHAWRDFDSNGQCSYSTSWECREINHRFIKHRPNSVVQNSDKRDFIENKENTQLKTASSWFDLNSDQEKIDGTRAIENSEDGYFPAIRPNDDRQV